MRTVKGPFMRPTRCAVTGREDGELIDFQTMIDQPEPYMVHLKKEIVEQAAREECGMLPATEVAALGARLDQLGAELDELRETAQLTAALEQRLQERNDS